MQFEAALRFDLFLARFLLSLEHGVGFVLQSATIEELLMLSTRTALRLWLTLSLGAGLTGAFIGRRLPRRQTWKYCSSWKLGGAGGWDYLTMDSAKKRLFISRATRVDVISVESGKLIGSIPDTQGVHGIALAPALNRGFTSNGRANSVTVFDLDTLEGDSRGQGPGPKSRRDLV